MTGVRVEPAGDVAVLLLDRPKANAFDPELVASLSRAFRGAGASRAVVLGSSQSLFSAGWDLPRVVGFGREEMGEFVGAFCDLIREIFVSGLPVVAALPGHAIAGGLILAAAADERIAAEGNGQYGLSEVVMGVPLPGAYMELFRHLLGPRNAERLAATGENLTVDGARALGLVDRVVPARDLLPAAIERARLLSGRPLAAHAAIKRRARAEAISRFDQAQEQDPFLDFWFAEEARERIAALVEKLKEKSAVR
jgi:enoyl-CoA hydratase